jgi:hypothetical protein
MRDVFFATTAAAALFSLPALTQQPSQDVASIPDFGGVWAHPSLNALEQPSSGPGPLRNRSRLTEEPQAGVGNRAQLVGDYTNPILQPWAQEVVKKFGEISLAGKGYPTPRNQCWPEGMPFVFSNYGMQLLSSRTKSPSFTPSIINSVKCA